MAGLVDANRASLAVAQDYALRHYGAGVAWDQSLHAMDYLEYAYCSLGRTMPQKNLSTMSTPSVRRRQRRPPPHMQWRPFRRAMPWSEGIGPGR